MPKYIILKFPLFPCFIGGVCKVGRTNMVPKHEIYRVENTSNQSLHNELRLHRTYAHSLVYRTLLEHLLIANTPLFHGTLVISLYSVPI